MEDDVPSMIEKFAPVSLEVSLGSLSDTQREMLAKLVQAGMEMEAVFWKQTWSGAIALRDRLRASSAVEDRRRLEEVLLMVGPYDRLEEQRPFIDGVPPKPAGAGFYPDDLTAEEFIRWVETHPGDRDAFESLTTVIRRDGDGLVAVPYRDAYRLELTKAAALLREAAALCENATLKRFLQTRADAFLSDDYFESDMAWMDVGNSTIDVTIGPYETYEDQLFGYKAAYEAYVGIVDEGESANLQTYDRYLDALDSLLSRRVPYSVNRGGASPIRVVNLLYNAGDARAGVQTTAFNLPNDERVHQARGTRKVMLRNVAAAKFEMSMLPIARALLRDTDLGDVTFNAYFTNVLLHEMAHGLGPTYLDGGTTVRKQLRELYSPIEEAKADIVGLYFHQWLIDRGVIEKAEECRAYTSFLAGFFRSIRFGVGEAHGKANIVELNYLQERGGVRYDAAAGRHSIDYDKIRAAVESLVDLLVGIEARGSYDEAKALLDKYGRVGHELEQALSRLQGVPVDIRPRYPFEEVLLQGTRT